MYTYIERDIYIYICLLVQFAVAEGRLPQVAAATTKTGCRVTRRLVSWDWQPAGQGRAVQTGQLYWRKLCAWGIIFVMSLGLNKYHKHSFILFNTLCARAKLLPRLCCCSTFCLSFFFLGGLQLTLPLPLCFLFLSLPNEGIFCRIALCVCVCVCTNLAKIH